MKKLLCIVFSLVISLSLIACGTSDETSGMGNTPQSDKTEDVSSEITIDGIRSAIQLYDPSFDFDDEKPMFSLIGAKDGWMGYTSDGSVVKIYQYAGEDEYNSAKDSYSSIMGEWSENGGFVIETNDDAVKIVFQTYNGNLDSVTVPEKPQTETVAFSVGESAELDSWSISVTGFEFLTRIDDGYGYFEPGEGNQFGVVSVSVTNNGTEADSFLPSFGFGDDVVAKIMYDGQYEYSATQLLAYDADLHDEFLNPLSSASGVIVFELPDTVVNGTESLTIAFTSGSNSTEFTLR